MASATDSTLNSLFFVNDQRTSRSFLVDSGAEVSVLPASSEDRRSASNGKSTSLSAANGSSIPTFGKRSLSFQLSGTKYEWSFILANVQRPILGADFLHATGLLIDVRHKRALLPQPPFRSTPQARLLSQKPRKLPGRQAHHASPLGALPTTTLSNLPPPAGQTFRHRWDLSITSPGFSTSFQR